MAKLVIVYDSKTGNTEKMAICIKEGAKRVSDVDVILKKVGEPFSCFEIFYGADAVIVGSPAYYGSVTPSIRDFLMCLRGAKESGKIEIQGKIGAAFGSYEWDGGSSTESLAKEMKDLGIKVESRILAQTPLMFHSALNEKATEECKKFGKNVAIKISNK